MDAAEYEAMWTPRCGVKPYAEWLKAFCERKYNSDFSREMSRSVGVYLRDFEDQ
jgi:nitroreductase/FMN reductase (NADPH)/FMN reductase [NAD(P)H]